MDASSEKQDSAITLTADVISAYVSNNHIQIGELIKLIKDVHGALVGIGNGAKPVEPPARATAAEIRRSVNHDFLISFEDGKPYKTLRRHLTIRGLTPEAYKAKWGLPIDYPLVSANYSARRSVISREIGHSQRMRMKQAAE